MDDYDYVMHGTCYQHEPAAGDGQGVVYVSFGGLLLKLNAPADVVRNITLDDRVYLLVRRE